MEYGLSNYEYRNVWQELPKQEIVVKDSGNDQNIYQKNSVAEVEIQQKPEVLKVLLRTDENVEISVNANPRRMYSILYSRKSAPYIFLGTRKMSVF